MATAPAPATSKTMWRSGSRQERVASRNRSMPPNSTHAIGTKALISQLMRNQGSSGSFTGAPAAGAPEPSSAMSGSTACGALEYSVLKKLARGRAAAATSRSAATSGLVCSFAVSGICMQSRQQVSDSEEREHHHREAEDGEVSRTAPAPAASDAHVEISGINEPGNRRPRLLGVPVPVGTPGTVSPVGAGGDHQGEQGEGNANRFVSDAVESVGVRKQSLEVGAPPQHQQIKQVGEDAANQSRKNERARRQARGKIGRAHV